MNQSSCHRWGGSTVPVAAAAAAAAVVVVVVVAAVVAVAVGAAVGAAVAAVAVAVAAAAAAAVGAAVGAAAVGAAAAAAASFRCPRWHPQFVGFELHPTEASLLAMGLAVLPDRTHLKCKTSPSQCSDLQKCAKIVRGQDGPTKPPTFLRELP